MHLQTHDKTHCSSFTDIGPVRKDNQDAMFSGIVKNGDGMDVVVVCVADGVGGTHHGAKASLLAVQSLQSFVLSHSFGTLEDIRAFIPAWLEKLNADIQEVGGTEESVNTTLTACFIFRNESLLVHVGDTRLYIVSDEKARLITHDHTLRNKMLRDGASEEDIEGVGENILASCLGSSCYGDVSYDCLSGFVDMKNPCWVIISSDGVHGKVGSADLIGLCQSAETVDGLAKDLVRTALAMGTRDNATAAVYRIGVMPVKTPPVMGFADLPHEHQTDGLRKTLIGSTVDGFSSIQWRKWGAIAATILLFSFFAAMGVVIAFWNNSDKEDRDEGRGVTSSPVVRAETDNLKPNTPLEDKQQESAYANRDASHGAKDLTISREAGSSNIEERNENQQIFNEYGERSGPFINSTTNRTKDQLDRLSIGEIVWFTSPGLKQKMNMGGGVESIKSSRHNVELPMAKLDEKSTKNILQGKALPPQSNEFAINDQQERVAANRDDRHDFIYIKITCEAGSNLIDVWNKDPQVVEKYNNRGWNFKPMDLDVFKKRLDVVQSWLDDSLRKTTPVLKQKTDIRVGVSSNGVVELIKKM